MKRTLIFTAALIAALDLSGCMVLMAGNGYHPDQGDLVSGDGTVRYVGWCQVHPHNAHCLAPQGPPVALRAARARPEIANDN